MKIYKRMVFLAPDDGGAGGAEPAPAPEAIDAPPVAQEPEYSKPKYYSQIESNMTQSREAQCGIAEHWRYWQHHGLHYCRYGAVCAA